MISKNFNGITFLTGDWPLAPEKPTIVFIHGAGDSSIFWKYQIEGLSDRINVIGIDLPGHGRSSVTGLDSISAYSKTVDDFICKAQIPSPIPCGLSMGGAITLQLLLDGKADYKGGITINSGAKLKVMPMIFEIIKNDFKEYVKAMEVFAVSEKTDKNKFAHIIESLAQTPPETVLNDFTVCDSFNVIDRLKEIKVPVLVITAEDDKLAPAKYGEFLINNIYRSSHVHINAAGHISPVEQPDEINKAIFQFSCNFFHCNKTEQLSADII